MLFIKSNFLLDIIYKYNKITKIETELRTKAFLSKLETNWHQFKT